MLWRTLICQCHPYFFRTGACSSARVPVAPSGVMTDSYRFVLQVSRKASASRRCPYTRGAECMHTPAHFRRADRSGLSEFRRADLPGGGQPEQPGSRPSHHVGCRPEPVAGGWAEFCGSPCQYFSVVGSHTKHELRNALGAIVDNMGTDKHKERLCVKRPTSSRCGTPTSSPPATSSWGRPEEPEGRGHRQGRVYDAGASVIQWRVLSPLRNSSIRRFDFPVARDVR